MPCLNCSKSSTGFTNVGDCFPDIPACADYNPATFEVQLLKKAHMQCSIRSQTPRLEPVPEWVPPPSSEPTLSPRPTTTLSPTGSPFDDTHRMKCQKAMNVFNPDGLVDLHDRYYKTLVERNNPAWRNQTFPTGTVWNGWETACKNTGGRFSTFTGVLDCIQHLCSNSGTITQQENGGSLLPAPTFAPRGGDGSPVDSLPVSPTTMQTPSVSSNDKSSGAVFAIVGGILLVGTLIALTTRQRRQQKRTNASVYEMSELSLNGFVDDLPDLD